MKHVTQSMKFYIAPLYVFFVLTAMISVGVQSFNLLFTAENYFSLKNLLWIVFGLIAFYGFITTVLLMPYCWSRSWIIIDEQGISIHKEQFPFLRIKKYHKFWNQYEDVELSQSLPRRLKTLNFIFKNPNIIVKSFSFLTRNPKNLLEILTPRKVVTLVKMYVADNKVIEKNN